MGTYKLAKLLLDCETQMEALASEVEELEAQLQSAKKYSADQEEKVKELAQRLKNKNKKIWSLRKQLEEMDQALHGARGQREALQEEVKHLKDLLDREAAANCHNECMKNLLMCQSSKVKEQLAKSAAFQLQWVRQFLYSCNMYEVALKFEQVKTDSLQKELEQEKRSLAEKVRAAVHHLQQHMEEEIDYLLKKALERKTSYTVMAKELEALGSQVNQFLANVALRANVKAEDKDSQDLRQETAELKVELLEPVPDSQVLELQTEVAVQAEELPTTKETKNREESDSNNS